MTNGGGEFFLLLPSLFFSREVIANFHADAVWVRWAWERTRRKLSTGNVENSENRFPLSLLSAMKNYSSDWKLGERMNSLSTFSRGRERELFTLKCGYRRRRFFSDMTSLLLLLSWKRRKKNFFSFPRRNLMWKLRYTEKPKGPQCTQFVSLFKRLSIYVLFTLFSSFFLSFLIGIYNRTFFYQFYFISFLFMPASLMGVLP